MDKLLAMSTFVQIVDSGSLTAAAEALDKSLPSIVRVLASLEDALGVRLLNRTTRKIALTDEGRQYLERCRQILFEIKDAELELSAQQSEPTGKLRVTSPMLFGQFHVTPLVTNFLKTFNQVEIDLLLLDRVVNLVDEGFDVAIRIGELEDSSLIAKRVGEVRRVVCASPTLIKSTSMPKHPNDLTKLQCTRHTGIASRDHWNFYENGKQKIVSINGPLVCNHAAATIQACAQGLGYGMFLSYQVASFVKSKQLKIILAEYEPAPLPVHIVFPQTKTIATRVRAFVDWMTVELRKILNSG